jgi:hypothetical protein
MESEAHIDTESKQITIDVPADRLAEFYAFFGRFLARGPGRGRRGHRGGPHHRGHHHCGHHGHEATEADVPPGGPAETTSV